MKIAFLADLHVNIGTYAGGDKDGLTFRMRDFIDAFKWAVNKIVEEIKPDIVFILGDIYEHPNPPSNIRRLFNSQISKLNAAGIAVHILVGNHDACKLHHALEPIEGMSLPNTYIYYSPKVVETASDKDPVFFVFPHSEKVERREISMRDYFLETVKEWRPQIKKLKAEGRQTFLLGHFPIKGASQADKAFNPDEEDISCNDIDIANPSYGLFGDFHATQKLGSKTDAMYVGSLERSNFNDITSKKGFVVYDSNGVENPVLGKHIGFVEYENARPMHLLKGNYDEIKKQIELLEDVKDSITKIEFQGDRTQYVQFDKEQASIKKKMLSSGAKLVLITSKIEDAARAEAAKRIQQEIQKMDDVEIGDVDHVVHSAVEMNSKDPVEAKITSDLSREIMATVRARRVTTTGHVTSGSVRIHGVKGHNFQKFGEDKNIIEFDQGARYFLGTGDGEIPQWQKEDFHRKGKIFLDKCTAESQRRILSIIGMVDNDPSVSNGSGKSTVIEMISYALYEKRSREYIHKFGDREKGKSTTSIMRERNGVIDCQVAFVDLLFSVDNSLWLLRRGRRIQGKDLSKHESILELHCITSDGFVYSEGSHGGHRGEDANKALTELVRMPFETFCNSLLFGQNDAGQFLVGTDKVRKEIIINILQLDILNEYLEETRGRKRILESETSSIKAQIEVLSEGAEELISNLQKSITEFDAKIVELESNISEIKKKISEACLTEFVSSYEKAKADVDAKSKEIENKSKEMEKELSNLQTQFETAKKTRTEKETLTKQIQKRIQDSKQLLLSHESSVEKFQEAKYASEMDLVNSAKKAKPGREEQKAKIQASLDSILPVYGELEGAIRERNLELESLKNLKEKCENGNKVQCAKCRQLVGIGHIEAEIIRVSSELSLKKSRRDELVKEKGGFEKEIKEVKIKLSNIEKYIEKESGLIVEKQAFENSKTQILEIKERIIVAEKELTEATESLMVSSNDKNIIEDKLNSISENKKKVLAPYLSEKAKSEESLRLAKDALAEAKKTLAAFETEEKGFLSSLDAQKALKSKAEAKIEATKDSLVKAKDLEKTLTFQLESIERLKVLDWVFGPDGAQVHIIEKYMPLLNYHLQEFLDIVSDCKIRASIVTDGKKEGKVEIVIGGDISSVSEGTSGGEGVKLRLSLDMALGMLSLTRANGCIDSIYIDEAIAAVDVDSKDRVFELLYKLQEHFRTVVIVSHDPALQEKIKETIVINKIDGISTVQRQYYELEKV